MKFSTKLTFAICSTGLVVLALLSFAMYHANYDAVMDSQSKVTESIAVESAADIDRLLSEKVKTALTHTTLSGRKIGNLLHHKHKQSPPAPFSA